MNKPLEEMQEYGYMQENWNRLEEKKIPSLVLYLLHTVIRTK